MRSTVLALILAVAAGLQVSRPVLPRANCFVRRSVLLMQEDEAPSAPPAEEEEAPAAVEAPAVSGDDQTTKGISGVLGGGKTSDQVEKSTAAELGSLAAFVVVLAGLTFGALNPDAIEDIAKSNSKCVQGKIVKGVRQECNADGTYIR